MNETVALVRYKIKVGFLDSLYQFHFLLTSSCALALRLVIAANAAVQTATQGFYLDYESLTYIRQPYHRQHSSPTKPSDQIAQELYLQANYEDGEPAFQVPRPAKTTAPHGI
jgi:hypothetical protein